MDADPESAINYADIRALRCLFALHVPDSVFCFAWIMRSTRHWFLAYVFMLLLPLQVFASAVMFACPMKNAPEMLTEFVMEDYGDSAMIHTTNMPNASRHDVERKAFCSTKNRPGALQRSFLRLLSRDFDKVSIIEENQALAAAWDSR